jgi:hypothetical protein
MTANKRCNVLPIIQIEPKYIAKAIAQVRESLDHADYNGDTYAGIALGGNICLVEQCYAWMMAAILLAHTAEMDSMTLRSLQTSIWKGEQDALFW